MIGFVGDNREQIAPYLYTDADLGGDADTQRSTSGMHLCWKGKHTNFPIASRSGRQTNCSSSTPEAEIVAAHDALKRIGVPAIELFEVLLSKDMRI